MWNWLRTWNPDALAWSPNVGMAYLLRMKKLVDFFQVDLSRFQVDSVKTLPEDEDVVTDEFVSPPPFVLKDSKEPRILRPENKTKKGDH